MTGVRAGPIGALTVTDRCTACGACLATCPTGALLPAPRRPLVDWARCTRCLECVEVCPRDAISTVDTASVDTVAAIDVHTIEESCR